MLTSILRNYGWGEQYISLKLSSPYLCCFPTVYEELTCGVKKMKISVIKENF